MAAFILGMIFGFVGAALIVAALFIGINHGRRYLEPTTESLI